MALKSPDKIKKSCPAAAPPAKPVFSWPRLVEHIFVRLIKNSHFAGNLKMLFGRVWTKTAPVCTFKSLLPWSFWLNATRSNRLDTSWLAITSRFNSLRGARQHLNYVSWKASHRLKKACIFHFIKNNSRRKFAYWWTLLDCCMLRFWKVLSLKPRNGEIRLNANGKFAYKVFSSRSFRAICLNRRLFRDLQIAKFLGFYILSDVDIYGRSCGRLAVIVFGLEKPLCAK